MLKNLTRPELEQWCLSQGADLCAEFGRSQARTDRFGGPANVSCRAYCIGSRCSLVLVCRRAAAEGAAAVALDVLRQDDTGPR